MFIVYVLYSDIAQKHYTGFTSNLSERLKSHNELGKDWTARYRPWRLIFLVFGSFLRLTDLTFTPFTMARLSIDISLAAWAFILYGAIEQAMATSINPLIFFI